MLDLDDIFAIYIYIDIKPDPVQHRYHICSERQQSQSVYKVIKNIYKRLDSQLEP